MKLVITILAVTAILGIVATATRLSYIKSLSEPNQPEPRHNSISTKSTDYGTYKLPEKESYTIILVGDSMTDSLGENTTQLRLYLKKYYPNKTFGIFNYGFGSTNLESLMDRLTTVTESRGMKFEPILSRQFDIIIIESFGHNPLSEYPLEQGLQTQEALLWAAIDRIRNGHPDSIVIFLATIGADRDNYASGIRQMSDTETQQWAEDRNAYIKNHIEFAKKYNIPVVKVYSVSTINGSVDPSLVDHSTWIHPSGKGIDLISRSIAEFIHKNKIIPN